MNKALFGAADFLEIEDVSLKLGLLNKMISQFYNDFDHLGNTEESRTEFAKILLFIDLIDSIKRETDQALQLFFNKMGVKYEAEN